MLVRVLPATENMMRIMHHPCGVRFMSMDRPAEWPYDQFTLRRLQEGSIKQVGKPYPGSPPAPAKQNVGLSRRGVKL